MRTIIEIPDTLIHRLKNLLEQIPVSSEIEKKAASVRKELKIRLPNAIIKATADCENALLISRNTKDFPEDDPSVSVPYRL